VQLATQQTHVAGHDVLVLIGDLDLSTLPRLHDALVRLATAPGTVSIADLTEVTVCEDAAIGVLLAGAARLRDRGGDLVVVCPAGHLRDRLTAMRIDRAVAIRPTRAEAIVAADAWSPASAQAASDGVL
jgi:anti-anti-sigma factor